VTRRDAWHRVALVLLLLAAAAASDGLVHAAWAQNPFGAPKNAVPDSQVGGVVGWLLAKQSEFYRQLSATIRAAKTDGRAVWALLGLSFAYGVFHAAGPGHGKAVISSYLVANEETARRGIVLSFVSALMQALVAIAIVGIGAAILNVTARQMCGAERVVEIASYGLIAAFGARLAWSKGGGFVRALRAWWAPAGLQPAGMQPAAATLAFGTARSGFARGGLDRSGLERNHGFSCDDPVHHGDGCGCGPHLGLWTSMRARAPQTQGDVQDHVHDAYCGCAHGPEPGQLAGPGGWARGFGAVLTVGIRPCSGAILVLVFALAQGLFWAGVAATVLMGLGTAITVSAIAILAVSAKGVARRLATAGDGSGALVMRGIEFGAAVLVLLFGVGLMAGYIAAERVTCF
jgi:ABC-type nickel/cobalt efflux system permease component RcnA